MSVHYDENAVKAHAEQIATTATKRKTRKLWLLSALSVLAVSGAAWAAITFTMNTSATAQADNGATPTISDTKFSGKFFPGAERDLIFTVSNTNDFPVKVTGVAATGASNFAGGCPNGANLSGAAMNLNQTVAIPGGGVVVPAGDSKVVTLPNAVKLADAATAGCSFKVDLKVTAVGSAGSGN